MSEVDKAFETRIENALKKYLIDLGIYENFDRYIIEMAAGNGALIRKARLELASLKKNNDVEGVKVVNDIIQEQREIALNNLEYFGIDSEKHKELAEMLGK